MVPEGPGDGPAGKELAVNPEAVLGGGDRKIPGSWSFSLDKLASARFSERPCLKM